MDPISALKAVQRPKRKLYDTLTRTEKELSPADGKTFRFYCCGPTVYGPAHIGNFRTFVLQDVLRRTLEAGGIKTQHVRNITDVDDKTIRQSQAEGKSLKEFTDQWKTKFHDDCKLLNILEPNEEPSAVGYIQKQIDLISQLIKKGHAYEKNGSVYYKVDSFDDYGKLTRLKERQITTNQPSSSEIEDADEYERDSAADFALWKARKPEDGQNSWPSPWGEGRPGWHIECSAMAKDILGDTIDLHSGGVDLCFPHHENEIAQSEGATGQPFANHWFHIAHLLVDGKKMSKSLGNLYTLEDITAYGFTPMELRYVLLSGHYKQSLNFTWNALSAARGASDRILQFNRDFIEPNNPPKWEIGQSINSDNLFQKAWESLNDDLNTPKALGEFFKTIREVGVRSDFDDSWKGLNEASYAAWQRMLYVLGFNKFFQKTEIVSILPELQKIAAERGRAKQNKDWEKADELREQLNIAGWGVKDLKDGTYYLFKLQKIENF